MERAYTVEGRWPFPLDMLRRDHARAATDADQILISRMSGEFSDLELGTRTKVRINLVMQADNRWHLPLDERWKSFGWTVSGVPEIDEQRQLDELRKQRQTIPAPTENEASLLKMLRELTDAAEGLNNTQHAGNRIRPEQWSDLYALTNRARHLIACVRAGDALKRHSRAGSV
jgi:hypothetical protein